MVGVGTHPLLPSSVIHDSLHLVGGHVADTHVRVREIGAQLLGLHPLPPGEATAQTLVDVTVRALAALVTELANAGCGDLAPAGLAHVSRLAVGVHVAAL